ncbi:hypothetical protein EMIHUDRAFT_453811, partial [Emiliania huxleyi CCMP1516]|uniref:PH domain-containing protein n=2 Tax=Emiliania huxleyi TaxID=2903 RepID=A0A0D3I0C9_EMIH1
MPPACSAPVILAIDRVLRLEGAWRLGLTPDDGWSENVAVLTSEALYFLDASEPEQLSPVGRSAGRLLLSDIADLVVSSIDGGEGSEMLRISVRAIFQGDALLRAPPGASSMPLWVEALASAMRGRLSDGAEAGPADGLAACLGAKERQLRVSAACAWWEARRPPTPQSLPSPQHSAGTLLRKRLLAGGAGEEAAGGGGGGAGGSSTGGGGGGGGGGEGGGGRWPWESGLLGGVRGFGVLEKRRDGMLRVGWVERLFVLWSGGGALSLLYYKRRGAEQGGSDELL